MSANQGYGFRRATAHFFIGGDWYQEDFYGRLKDIRFYYNTALSETLLFSNMKN